MSNIINKLYSILETGDLILFSNTELVSCCIKCVTCSKYSHIGMVLKNPTYINKKLTGLYLWQSGKESFPESEDDKLVFGVQISPLDKVLDGCNLNNVYVRKLNLPLKINDNPSMVNKLTIIHREIHKCGYNLNPMDWLLAGEYELENWLNLHENDKIVLLKKNHCVIPSTVWCSALVGFIYYNLNLIKKPEWKFLSPRDWSYKNDKLLQLSGCSLGKDTVLKKFLK